MEQELGLQLLSQLGDYTDKFAGRDSEYVLVHITPDIPLNEARGNMRLDGFMIMMCLAGRMTLEANFETWEMDAGSVIVSPHDSIINLTSFSPEVEAYMLFLSPEFIRGLDFDTNIISRITPSRHNNPVLSLEKGETELIMKYVDLLHHTTIENTTDAYARSISRSLVVAMIYQLMQFVELHHPDECPGDTAPATRRGNYVRDFFKLIHTHYRRERSVTFYASKLFISPKYLSVIVKEQTGKSAGEWIDQLVILDAKNRLRYSGKNVQQIAYELNFVNQSSFGKYFKHLTGMTPTQFQKS